ncbi:unnamed protein product [Clavelina lepadiformis]|uniref:Uncharacterized protein n=1 Tax=Clavelina lepadiformis TaxID=159417 RepID=A0ABP0F2T2_CLALP
MKCALLRNNEKHSSIKQKTREREKDEKKDDIKEESSADAIAATAPKNKKVLHALDTIRRRLQFEGADMATFVRLDLETQMQESMQNKIK